MEFTVKGNIKLDVDFVIIIVLFRKSILLSKAS